ncbi:NAD(P)/FAD-dependent oxidoreductase [Pedobacter steynii]|uniref:FAD-dependent oxidoreductase n=1 Tax=Pedobacter steynii TaxID=430522 RepID=A0A1D7QDL2_9SPHI|nr:FAD-dependent oxidoreductase [Pedobacter steynii]AOM76704.1 FAD-dependent oxidoreductase [Pedobacter steynii]
MDIRSNEPFWLVKNGLLYTYPSLRDHLSCDILIVGSGITGALMAHSFVEKGYDTVLIDKREIANGSSSATTSMLQYEIDVPLHELIDMIGEQGAVASYKACRDSIDRLQQLVKDVDSPCGFEQKDSLYFASKSKDVKWLKKEFDARKRAGFKVQWLEKKEIKQKYGLLTEGGILSSDGGSVDAFCLAHDLLHYNTKRGLRVFDKTELKKVKYEKDKVLAEIATGAVITAGKIVYCTGYETQVMLPERIVNLKSTYAMVSEKNEALPASISDTLFWNTDAPYLYMRTTADGRLLVGGEDENFRNALKRDALLGRKKDKLVKTVEKFMPGLRFIGDFCWCGTFGETKDGLPYIGAHPKFPNSYFVLGFGGNGITFSVLGMDIIPEMIRDAPSLLSHYFRFGR